MPDPRRQPLSTGTLVIKPAEAPERWEVSATGARTPAVEAHWGDWVRLARRILEVDQLSRDREGRGDAWDQGYAAARADDAVNPFR